jgi:hypothetical protein
MVSRKARKDRKEKNATFIFQCRLVKKILSVTFVPWCLGGRKKAPLRHKITKVSQS